ncbi:MAG: elongation factor GreAB [Elusimicrobia bacterium]|nr:MAG: elongation factor GreAB [Elusimicrobiota bacterium]KAF0155469.1 MAG: elongation factor GreAB [Elusimicrobiota bacterium]
MSRAFVKNEGESAPAEPVERRPSGRPNYVTAAGLKALEEKVAGLARRRDALLAEKGDAERGLELRQAELDLLYYEGKLKQAILLDNRGASYADARFGASVRVRGAGGDLKDYVIVGEDEADAPAGLINWASPLAGALLGARAGDRVVWKRRLGDMTLEIISVTYPEG